MLYDRWREVARSCPDEVAMRDLDTGEAWTFARLTAVAEQGGDDASTMVHPVGLSPAFVIQVLRAWRQDRVVCPLEADQNPPRVERPLPRGVKHLKSTSATSGAPRLIAFTPAQLIADAENIVTTMGLRRDCPNLGAISLAHSYGFSNLVLPLLLHGVPLYLVHAPFPELIRRGAELKESLTLAAVPALWRTWHEADAIPKNVRLAISAGAPLPLGLEQRVFSERGLKIHNFYGSSECGGIAYDATPEPRKDAALAGAPLHGVQVSISAEGCLQVRSAAVAESYWPEPGDNLRDGVFRSSDLAQIVFDTVHLRGRISDQINVAGRKLSPEVVEKVLLQHPAVRECLVFGAPIDFAERSEIIVACIVAREPVSDEALRQFLLEQLPAWQIPREWWRVGSLEANSRGKLSRADWRKRFLELTAAGENMP